MQYQQLELDLGIEFPSPQVAAPPDSVGQALVDAAHGDRWGTEVRQFCLDFTRSAGMSVSVPGSAIAASFLEIPEIDSPT